MSLTLPQRRAAELLSSNRLCRASLPGNTVSMAKAGTQTRRAVNWLHGVALVDHSASVLVWCDALASAGVLEHF